MKKRAMPGTLASGVDDQDRRSCSSPASSVPLFSRQRSCCPHCMRMCCCCCWRPASCGQIAGYAAACRQGSRTR